MTDTVHDDPSSIDGWLVGLPLLNVDEGPRPPERESDERSTSGTTRRRFMQAAVAIGGGLSLGVLGALSGGFRRPALAAVGSQWSNCAGYDNSTGYIDNTLVCTGPANYSYRYCGTDGWFRNHIHDGWEYFPRAICGQDAYSKREAWLWPYRGHTFRCADGVRHRLKVNGDGKKEYDASDDLICSQWVGYA